MFTRLPTKIQLDPATTELRGTLHTIRYHGNGFLIGMLEGGVVVKGPILAPQIGAEYVLRGKVVDDPKWGRQFAFTEHEAKIPDSREAFRAYLEANAKWIGPAISAAIVDLYGTDAVRILKAEPNRVAREVKGVTPARAAEIAAMLGGLEKSEAVELELRKLLVGTGLGRSFIAKILEAYGQDAPQRIRENPYQLAEDIDGIGFLKADQVALVIRCAPDSPFRIRAGLVHVLEEAASSQGHVCMPRNALIRVTCELLEVDGWLVGQGIEALAGVGKVVIAEEFVYLKRLHADEQLAAERIRAMATPAPIPTAIMQLGLYADQLKAIQGAATSKVFVLTGAPGTGKTHTIKQIVQLAAGRVVELCAPTGKAAKRMEEQTGMAAKTMHRLLEPKMVGNRFVFSRDAANPIDADMVVIDETSMVDVSLAARFLEAIRDETRLVFVGDVHQLPSVGPGNVLGQLITSGRVPFVELDVIKRQDEAGLIVKNCHAIKNGAPLQLAEDWAQDFVFLERNGEMDIGSTVVEMVTQKLPALEMVEARDIQVIVPMRERTQLSAAALNAALRARLNPDRRTIGGLDPEKFRVWVGDKVIQTRNDYKLEVMNGDIGRVLGVNEREKTFEVEFDTPRRMVDVPMYDNQLELAYALTCHKFQGSEARVVVVPVCRAFGPMVAQRNWLYTAVSRARDLLVLVGEREEVAKVVARNRPRLRWTRLGQLIRGEHE